MNLKFRDLTKNDIEVRVANQEYNPQTKRFGVSLLLYKDARVDANILDETVGNMSWDREHFVLGGAVACKVTIRYNGESASKMDVGNESNIEATKGAYSDSFKRACFAWNIGRELYTSPKIVVYEDTSNLKDKDGKKTTYDKFKVAFIEINDKVITGLVIRNETTGRICYEYGTGANRTNVLESLINEKGQDLHKFYKWLTETKNVEKVEDLPEDEYNALIRRLV